MNLARTALLLALPLTSSLAFAAVKTVTLSVPGMTCELCPITIRKAVSRVPGVSKVDASYDTKQAVVTLMMPKRASRRSPKRRRTPVFRRSPCNDGRSLT